MRGEQEYEEIFQSLCDYSIIVPDGHNSCFCRFNTVLFRKRGEEGEEQRLFQCPRYQAVGDEHPFGHSCPLYQFGLYPAIAQVSHLPGIGLGIARSGITAHADVHLPRTQQVEVAGKRFAQAVQLRSITAERR